jgi:hypothetical protein
MSGGDPEPARIAARELARRILWSFTSASPDRGGFGPNDIDNVADLLDSQAARLTEVTAERDEALRVLNPTCAEETLVGAIRNLQQVALSEKGNAETAEQAHADLRARLEQLENALRQVDSMNEHRGMGEHCTCSQHERHAIVSAALAAARKR